MNFTIVCGEYYHYHVYNDQTLVALTAITVSFSDLYNLCDISTDYMKGFVNVSVDI